MTIGGQTYFPLVDVQRRLNQIELHLTAIDDKLAAPGVDLRSVLQWAVDLAVKLLVNLGLKLIVNVA